MKIYFGTYLHLLLYLNLVNQVFFNFPLRSSNMITVKSVHRARLTFTISADQQNLFPFSRLFHDSFLVV